jgi:hypothetical protein
MLRWQEEWEQRVVELARVVRYFDYMSTIWKTLASQRANHIGERAYASRMSARLLELSWRALSVFQQAKTGYFGPITEEDVAHYVIQDRASFKAQISGKIHACQGPRP